MGLGIAYAGSKNEKLRHILTDILIDEENSISVTAFTAISLGLIYVGSCNEEVAETLISVLMARIEAELEQPLTRLLPLGLGLLYLGKKVIRCWAVSVVSFFLPLVFSNYCNGQSGSSKLSPC
ncbi:hypothetical protein KIW84_052920 [Lathyrus oleraceus]|uniref:Uncharacterized protein n=1 Tax=Pisum sativum TaxID=3888 RepID=A0A9D4WRC7_PEA|nr:hypothetical protein KIW84_052918 [Pisum sativum]KAI5406384.1 hypothetical protein KIW84_052920 [Pisum sativum]